MIKRTALFLIMITSGLSSIPTMAWNALGHQVIAHIAYQGLKPNVKNKVDGLVTSFNHDYQNVSSFEQLSVWPDAIRSQKIDTYTRWHYIDTPLFEKKGMEMHTDSPSDNAVWALEKIKPVVENDQANVFERARFLAFLIHIVADLHQPLHTVSLYSPKHPEGDRGGNSYIVRYHNKVTNLHSLWDKGVGAFEGQANFSSVDKIATSLMHQYPKTYFGGRADEVNVNVWVDEGMKNAKTVVYNTPEGQAVSTAYIKAGEQLAEEEATLAGYRLANILNQLLG